VAVKRSTSSTCEANKKDNVGFDHGTLKFLFVA